jgi:hypothetical protein
MVIFAHLDPDPEPADQNRCRSKSTAQTKGISFYPTNSSINLEKFLAPSLPQLMIITRRRLASYGGNL